MPRNGDGSGDSGPYEAHEIVHGTDGDETLQHTKHVAPMPKLEEGGALPGMNASGGVAAPLNDASEEYRVNAPRNEQFGEDDDSTSKSGTSGSQASSSQRTSSFQHTSASVTSSSKESSGHNTRGSNKEHEEHDLEDPMRETAKRYVNLDEADVQHAGTSNKSNESAERSSQRAPRDVGPKEDIEQLHGKASAGKGDTKSEQRGNEKSGNYGTSEHGQRGSEKSGQHGSNGNEQRGGERRGEQGSGNAVDENGDEIDPMRHNAAKFVNIGEE
ncbi:hypothetical protein CC86DRAFT_436437 [Ophiobolus disseminans]|uniref:Uncharacterized protein n=1 Tax=Ophiobolus disseminans TaxID=1469910 RepID=A0A6A7AC66_9PLEO|nr:hypothetical protein CC86DRAFT_436437 [Ophiobolus disseminans]